MKESHEDINQDIGTASCITPSVSATQTTQHIIMPTSRSHEVLTSLDKSRRFHQLLKSVGDGESGSINDLHCCWRQEDGKYIEEDIARG